MVASGGGGGGGACVPFAPPLGPALIHYDNERDTNKIKKTNF